MKKKDEKRNEIIKASINLMYLNGYNGTSVKDITDAAGIPKGSFYNYFKDKEDYAVKAMMYYSEYMTSTTKKALTDTSLKPLDRILFYFKLRIKNLIERELKYGCFIGNLSQEMGDISVNISDAANEIIVERILSIHKNLLEAREDDSLKTDIDLKILANFIQNSWQGTLIRMKVSSDIETLNEFYYTLSNLLLK